MKRYIFLLIFILLMNHDSSFGEEKSYDKYLKIEEQVSSSILKPYENDKSLIQKFMLYEDCKMFCRNDENIFTIGKEIMLYAEKMKAEPKSLNYKYAVKTYDLYKLLCKEFEQYLGHKKTIINTQDKLIMIPDEDFDKLDKAIILYIILLNSSLR